MFDTTPPFNIVVCTRGQAIGDGILVDVTEEAREARVPCPVALTREVWSRYVAVDDGVKHAGLPRCRLARLLRELRIAICEAHQDGNMTRFDMWCAGNDGSIQRAYLAAELGYGDDGELAITVGLDRVW